MVELKSQYGLFFHPAIRLLIAQWLNWNLIQCRFSPPLKRLLIAQWLNRNKCFFCRSNAPVSLNRTMVELKYEYIELLAYADFLLIAQWLNWNNVFPNLSSILKILLIAQWLNWNGKRINDRLNKLMSLNRTMVELKFALSDSNSLYMSFS